MVTLTKPRKGRAPARTRLKDLTISDLGGGLDEVNSDIGMNARFQCILKNFTRTPSNGQRLRLGSKWFEDVGDVVSGDIVDMVYFSNAIVTPTDDGEVAAVDDDGTKVAIWNAVIAGALLGSPTGWSAGLNSIDFVPFKNKLIIHNGVDKPIIINSDLEAQYLADEGTGSNTNVPIGRYGCVVSNYHCVAGLPAAPTTVYVTSRGTSGTFPGDPAPNDAISIDVGAYAPEGSPEIRGIAGFRSYLIVFFQGQALLIKLGIYDDAGNHTPDFQDTMPSLGLFGHRTMAQVEGDLSFGGISGMGSAKRNLLSGLVDSTPLSDIVEQGMRRVFNILTDEQQLRNCFMIHDKLAHETIVYAPDGTGYKYSANERLRYKAWSKVSGPAWIAGCTSSLDRVFYSDGSRIFLAGNYVFEGEDYHADRIMDRDANWNTGTTYFVGDLIFDEDTEQVFECNVSHISGANSFLQDRVDQTLDPKWELYEGREIEMELESPWIEGRDPRSVKILKFISMVTKGTAEFTFKVWVDNLYKDENGDVLHQPALSMDFIGNDAPGFGFDAGPYGGGRRSNDPRQFKYPAKFKTLKFGIVGMTRKPIEFQAVTFLYAQGNYKR